LSPKVIKSMIIIAAICVIGGIGGYVLLSMLPPKPDWLYGHWWYDAPEGAPQDSMLFKPKGTVDFLSAEEKTVRTCRYTTLVENQVNIRCREKNNVINFVLKYRNSNGARDLVDHSGKVYFKQ